MSETGSHHIAEPVDIPWVHPIATTKMVQLLATKATTGNGTEEDPVRTVHHLFTHEGVLVAVYDPAVGGRATEALAKLLDGPMYRMILKTGNEWSQP